MSWEVPATLGGVYLIADVSKAVDIGKMTRYRDRDLAFDGKRQTQVNAAIFVSQPIGPFSLATKWYSLWKHDKEKREIEKNEASARILNPSKMICMKSAQEEILEHPIELPPSPFLDSMLVFGRDEAVSGI